MRCNKSIVILSPDQKLAGWKVPSAEVIVGPVPSVCLVPVKPAIVIFGAQSLPLSISIAGVSVT